MSSFGGEDFKVIPTNGMWPAPFTDDDGIDKYSATIRIETVAAFKALYGMKESVTLKRAGGTKGGTAFIDSGGDSHDLLVPVARGTEGTMDAVLVDFRPDVRARWDDQFEADCTWVILSDPTP